MPEPSAITVVKVGGSLLTWPDLGPRLNAWLADCGGPALLVPGGGPVADAVRRYDAAHALGAESAHWLAIRAMGLNAHVLAALVPGACVVDTLPPGEAWPAGAAILDPLAVLRADEGQPGCLPHTWDVTSDAIAARVAVLLGARRLVLLKSVDVPPDADWHAAARQGWVDSAFAGALAAATNLHVTAVNLRAFPWE